MGNQKTTVWDGHRRKGRKEAEWSHVSSSLGLTWLFLPVAEGVTGRLSSASLASLPLWVVRGRGKEHLLEAAKGNLLQALDVLNDSCHHCIYSNFSFLSHNIRELSIFSILGERDKISRLITTMPTHVILGCSTQKHHKEANNHHRTSLFYLFQNLLLMSAPFTCS